MGEARRQRSDRDGRDALALGPLEAELDPGFAGMREPFRGRPLDERQGGQPDAPGGARGDHGDRDVDLGEGGGAGVVARGPSDAGPRESDQRGLSTSPP